LVVRDSFKVDEYIDFGGSDRVDWDGRVDRELRYLVYWIMTKRARPQGQAVPEGSMPRQAAYVTWRKPGSSCTPGVHDEGHMIYSYHMTFLYQLQTKSYYQVRLFIILPVSNPLFLQIDRNNLHSFTF
jgi:hypothetical protein